MFVGYASNHKGDCYRMWNPKTKRVSKTHDVVFLNKMLLKATNNKEYKEIAPETGPRQH